MNGTNDKVTYDTYLESPIICIPIKGTMKKMAFGVNRAKCILAHISEIKAFVKEHEKKKSKNKK